MSRLNRIIAFVAILSVPLALIGSPFRTARIDVPGMAPPMSGAPADCSEDPCTRTGPIPDADLWRAAATADTPDAYWTYLRRHPDGAHAVDARLRLERLSVSSEPPLHFAAETVPPRPIAEQAAEEGSARRGVYRFPTFLLASAPMDGGAASLVPANGSAASPRSMPAAAPAEEGGTPGRERLAPIAAANPAAPPAGPAPSAADAPSAAAAPLAAVAAPVKAPASALSYAAAARSGRSRSPGFRPHRSGLRRLELSELVAPHAGPSPHAARPKAVRAQPSKQVSGVAVRPQRTSARARRAVRSAAPSHAKSGARQSAARKTRHARRVASSVSPGMAAAQRRPQARAAPFPDAVSEAQDCAWPFCFGN